MDWRFFYTGVKSILPCLIYDTSTKYDSISVFGIFIEGIIFQICYNKTGYSVTSFLFLPKLMVFSMKYFNKLLLYLTFFCGFLLIFAPSGYGGNDEIDFLSDDFYEIELEFVEFHDPLEPFNRVMFQFNDTTYTYIFHPVARGYAFIVPQDIRGSLNNFFRNLEEPVRFFNCLLQGRVSDAGTVLMRFVINTLGGVAGFGDLAGRELGFLPVEASLGETFAVWGIGDGAYLVVPFYGPSTIRDFTGSVIDGLLMTPYYSFTDSRWVTTGIHLGRETNKLSLNLSRYKTIKRLSFDPYVAIRNGFFQHREKIRDHGREGEN